MYWHLYADVPVRIHPLENVHKICLPWLAFQRWGVRSCCWSTSQLYLRSHGWWLPPHPYQWTGAQAMWERRDVADIIIVTMFLHVKAVGNSQIFAFLWACWLTWKLKPQKFERVVEDGLLSLLKTRAAVLGQKIPCQREVWKSRAQEAWHARCGQLLCSC